MTLLEMVGEIEKRSNWPGVARTSVPRLCAAIRILAEAVSMESEWCDETWPESALAAAEAALRGEKGERGE